MIQIVLKKKRKARKKQKILASLFSILCLNLLILRHKQNEYVHTIT